MLNIEDITILELFYVLFLAKRYMPNVVWMCI